MEFRVRVRTIVSSLHRYEEYIKVASHFVNYHMLCLLDANILHEKQIWIDNKIENNGTNNYDLQYNAGTFYYLALINKKER